MKAPAGILFHQDASLLVWRPKGVINEAAVDRLIAYLDNLELRLEKPFNRFTDSLEADAVDLNFGFIFQISLYRRLAYDGPPIQSAILVTDASLARYAKMHALLTQGSSIKVRLFQKREEVAEWLGVPIEVLTRKGVN